MVFQNGPCGTSGIMLQFQAARIVLSARQPRWEREKQHTHTHMVVGKKHILPNGGLIAIYNGRM